MLRQSLDEIPPRGRALVFCMIPPPGAAADGGDVLLALAGQVGERPFTGRT